MIVLTVPQEPSTLIATLALILLGSRIFVDLFMQWKLQQFNQYLEEQIEMVDLNKYRSNTTAEEEGTRVDIDEDTYIVVARWQNKAFKEKFRTYTEPYRTMLKAGTLSESKAEEIIAKVMAETVLIGWGGFTDNGKPFPYSRENALKLLSDPGLHDFREFVEESSKSIELFRQKTLEEDEGNSRA